jgi:hypothetical protein
VSKQIEFSSTEPSEVSIDQIAVENLDMRLTTSQKSRIGKDVARRFRQANPDKEIHTVEKYVNGEMRNVKIYPRSFSHTIEECITESV